MNFSPTLHKLSNGVTVILDPMDLESVAVKVRFATGSRDETLENCGITHFCEHMLMKGTQRFPSRKAARDYIENKGGMFGAATSHTGLELEGRIITENTNDLLEIFADSLQNALFDSEQIDLERSVILDELRRAQGLNGRKYRDLIYKSLLGFSSYKNLGTEENIKSFTRNQMLDWLQKRLSAKNCTICISGCINDKDVVLNKLEELFRFLPTHDVPKNTKLTYTPCDKFLSEPSLKNVWVDILFPYIRPNTYENIFKNKAEAKFHKYLMQELGEIVRHKNGLVYGLNFCDFGNEFVGVCGVHTETSPENLGKTVALIAQTSYRVYNNDKVTQPVIERFRNINKLFDANFLESATQRRDTLVFYWEDFGKLYDYNHMTKMNNSITADDVINASNGFFDGPMSIMSFGVEHNLDLRKIWIDNFK